MSQISKGAKTFKKFLFSGTMSRAEIAGLSLFMVIFGIIMIPSVSSEADPYGISWPLNYILHSIELSNDLTEPNSEVNERVTYKIKVRLDQPFDQNQFQLKVKPETF